jgi:hypothetical protein
MRVRYGQHFSARVRNLTQLALLGVAELEVLILELGAVDGLATGAYVLLVPCN